MPGADAGLAQGSINAAPGATSGLNDSNAITKRIPIESPTHGRNLPARNGYVGGSPGRPNGTGRCSTKWEEVRPAQPELRKDSLGREPR
jgi:hypothetical protein